MVTWVTPLLSPVLAPHEPDCLGKAVGERRQLGSAMRQTFDGLQLLRGSGGDGFGFLRRGVGTRSRRRRCRGATRSEEHTSELQSQSNLVCRLLLEKKKKNTASDDTE